MDGQLDGYIAYEVLLNELNRQYGCLLKMHRLEKEWEG